MKVNKEDGESQDKSEVRFPLHTQYGSELSQRRMITELVVERNLYKGTHEQKYMN